MIGLSSAASINLLSNPSYENGSPLAIDWLDEHTTPVNVTYSISTTEGVIDGTKSQKIVYNGQPTDDGTKKLEIFHVGTFGYMREII